jgi:hypothetical protein
MSDEAEQNFLAGAGVGSNNNVAIDLNSASASPPVVDNRNQTDLNAASVNSVAGSYPPQCIKSKPNNVNRR